MSNFLKTLNDGVNIVEIPNSIQVSMAGRAIDYVAELTNYKDQLDPKDWELLRSLDLQDVLYFDAGDITGIEDAVSLEESIYCVDQDMIDLLLPANEEDLSPEELHLIEEWGEDKARLESVGLCLIVYLWWNHPTKPMIKIFK